MNGKIIGILLVIIVLGGGWYLLSKTPASAPTTDTAQTGAETTPAASSSAVTVTYTDEGFSPKEISIPLGTTVTFINQSTGKMWVASAMHPSHTVYSGTSLAQHCPDTTSSSFDQCASGDSFSFTFTKEGTWKYHDHVDASHGGSVIVTAAASI